MPRSNRTRRGATKAPSYLEQQLLAPDNFEKFSPQTRAHTFKDLFADSPTAQPFCEFKPLNDPDIYAVCVQHGSAYIWVCVDSSSAGPAFARGVVYGIPAYAEPRPECMVLPHDQVVVAHQNVIAYVAKPL